MNQTVDASVRELVSRTLRRFNVPAGADVGQRALDVCGALQGLDYATAERVCEDVVRTCEHFPTMKRFVDAVERVRSASGDDRITASWAMQDVLTEAQGWPVLVVLDWLADLYHWPTGEPEPDKGACRIPTPKLQEAQDCARAWLKDFAPPRGHKAKTTIQLGKAPSKEFVFERLRRMEKMHGLDLTRWIPQPPEANTAGYAMEKLRAEGFGGFARKAEMKS